MEWIPLIESKLNLCYNTKWFWKKRLLEKSDQKRQEDRGEFSPKVVSGSDSKNAGGSSPKEVSGSDSKEAGGFASKEPSGSDSKNAGGSSPKEVNGSSPKGESR